MYASERFDVESSASFLAVTYTIRPRFTVQGQSSDCDFKLMLECHGSCPHAILIKLSGHYHDASSGPDFSCGSELSMITGSSLLCQVDQIIERLEHLTPAKMGDEMRHLFTDAITSWMSETPAPRNNNLDASDSSVGVSLQAFGMSRSESDAIVVVRRKRRVPRHSNVA